MVVIVMSACSPPAPPLPQRYQLPPFTLTERSGQPFDSATLRGKVWVADFFFANCVGTCLVLNNSMAGVHKAFAGNDAVRFLSISTDAANDTPAALTAYAKQHFPAADHRWSFVVGPKERVFDLSIQGFKLALVEQPDAIIADQKFIHSTKLVLVDKAGWIRGYYDGIGEAAEKDRARLIADIQRLLTE
jgi:protein SCO1